jgi:hypothetical protein
VRTIDVVSELVALSQRLKQGSREYKAIMKCVLELVQLELMRHESQPNGVVSAINRPTLARVSGDV